MSEFLETLPTAPVTLLPSVELCLSTLLTTPQFPLQMFWWICPSKGCYSQKFYYPELFSHHIQVVFNLEEEVVTLCESDESTGSFFKLMAYTQYFA